MSGVDDGFDPQRDPLTGWLTQLADDPDAPPSNVTALSVIAAAKAEARAAQAETGAAAGPSPVGNAPAPPVVHQRSRSNRRRIFLGGLVAAASLAAIAAVVIPVTLSGSSSNTSADSARVASATSAAMAEQSAAGLAAPSVEGDAAADEEAESPPAAGGAGPETGRADAGAAEDSIASASAACWPALTPAVSEALLAALPPGEFEDPVPLTADCGSTPVGGGVLAGTEPGTVLVVRISGTEPGACATNGGAVAEPCAPQGGDVYLATDDAGAVTAVVYGNGFEVAIGGWPAIGDSVAIGSGLTDDQLVAAAQAVLGGL